MIYRCIIDNCNNKITPCLHGDSCNECKIKLIKFTNNDITRNLPQELINTVCEYINNKNNDVVCIYCNRYICDKCYSNSYNTANWCCNCYINF